MYQQELAQLEHKYKERETASLQHQQVPEQQYLCIRMDGFHLTKKFLKDMLVNHAFNEALQETHQSLFCAFRHFLNKQFTSSIVCSFIANDEVSVVLNKDNDNFNRRIMKLCSLFSGVVSSAMTTELQKRIPVKSIVAFDARPILLNDKQEVVEYVRSRYLIANRYAYWKALRLNKVDNIYDPIIMADIDRLKSLAAQHKLLDKAKKIRAGFKLYIPEQTKKPKTIDLSAHDQSMSQANLQHQLSDYLSYLHNEMR